jgi:hypothetical protein
MNDVRIARHTGTFGIACVALTFGQFPLWLVGSAPSVYDGRGFAQHLFDIKNVALTRILMDQGIYLSMLVFAVAAAAWATFDSGVLPAGPDGSRWLAPCCVLPRCLRCTAVRSTPAAFITLAVGDLRSWRTVRR